MNRLKLEIRAAFDGQVPMSYQDPGMAPLLAELRAAASQPEEQRLLGMFVLSLLSARIKSNLLAIRGNPHRPRTERQQ